MNKREFFDLVSMWSVNTRRRDALRHLADETDNAVRKASLANDANAADEISTQLAERIHEEVDRVNKYLREHPEAR